ncbi:uncharacterized protein LOC142606320 [Castanea sativa]|uniref:uncharacterized protein LOC142606320 n=1 Tax=Castanea sativa TaxID=21020 RepID=UPI003F6542AD
MAAAPTIRCLALTVLTIIFLWNSNIHEVYARECQALDTSSFLIGCVQGKGRPKVTPTDLCCQAVKELTVPCICKGLFKEIENLYNMDDFVYVVNYCGGSLKPRAQCGSYKVPPL